MRLRPLPAALVVLIVPLALACAAALLYAPVTLAHAPLGSGDNESLATATVIPEPTKSWAIYADLHEGGEAQYYRFDATKGEAVALQLFGSPAASEHGFIPSLAIMGPGVPDAGTAPAFLEKPGGAGVQIIAGRPSTDVSYEPFSPSAMRELASTTFVAPQDGTYYLAVFGNDRGGRYGLAVGTREAFTLREWVAVPLFVATVYTWEGQRLWLAYLPAVVVFVAGLIALGVLVRHGGRLDLPGWTAAVAALLFVASGVTVAVQMVVALSKSGLDPLAAATLVLAALPVALGALTLWLAFRNSGRWSRRSRLALVLLGVAGLFVWAGWIVGPIVAVLAALLPSSARRGAHRGAALR